MMREEERQQWADYICASDHAGRHLYASGAARRAQTEGGLDKETLRRFLDRLADRDTDRRHLGLVYFLLQPRLLALMSEHLPDLLRSMSHASADRMEQSRRGTRGKVLWPQTITARVSGRVDAGTLVLKRLEKSADVPENQLLKLFLFDVIAAVDSIARKIGSGNLLQQIEQVRQQAQVALKSPYLRGVTRHYHAVSLMRQRARRHRNWVYGELTELQSLYDALDGKGYWEALLGLLQAGWLEPVKTDDLFELYVLVVVLEVLETTLCFGLPIEFGLIREGRNDVAHFKRPGDQLEARVFFDQSPAVRLNMPSEYMSLLSCYDGISGGHRRPDLFIQFVYADGTQRRLLIEIKETDDARYERDSVYKALAYLRDFAALWSGLEQHPKIILAFPNAVALKISGADHLHDLVFWRAEDRIRLTALIERVLLLPPVIA